MIRPKSILTVVVGCLVLGLATGAVVSANYWGYPFARPAIPEVVLASRVLSVTSLGAAERGAVCALEAETLPDLHQHLAGPRKYVDEFPHLRALVALEDRGLLPPEARAPGWLELPILHRAVVDSGIVVEANPGYDAMGCFGGYLIELSLLSGESRLLLTARGEEVSNDHYPYYELLFRREGTQLIPVRKEVSFFDIAGFEGFEWPLLHGAIVLLYLMAAWGTTSVLLVARVLARSLTAAARPK